MGKLSESCYAFPILGGFIALLGLVCPAAYYYFQEMGYGEFVWVWGAVIYRLKGTSRIYFLNTDISQGNADVFGTELFGFLTALITTLGIAISSLILIITAQRFKHNKIKEGTATKIWLIAVLTMIGVCIFWIIAVEYYYGVYTAHIARGYPSIVKLIFGSQRTKQFSFWSFFNPSFGIILPFIGAGIAAIGIYVR